MGISISKFILFNGVIGISIKISWETSAIKAQLRIIHFNDLENDPQSMYYQEQW